MAELDAQARGKQVSAEKILVEAVKAQLASIAGAGIKVVHESDAIMRRATRLRHDSL